MCKILSLCLHCLYPHTKGIVIRMEATKTINTRTLWENIIEELKAYIPETNIKTWFSGTHVVRIEDEKLMIIGVPNEFVRTWIQKKYEKLILSEINKQIPSIKALKFIISKKSPSSKKNKNILTKSNVPFSFESIDKNTNLNPSLNFDELIVAPYIEFAHSAARMVIEKPGLAYNPLFIYGKTGVGKTHLIQAIGNKILNQVPNANVYYVPSETLLEEFVTGIRDNKIDSFRKKYQSFNVLIIDDVHFFANKARGMEELFLMFNSYYNHNKQMIFSSDRPPSEMKGVESRLRSRFQSGMIMDIQDPNHESMYIILKEKAKRVGIDLNDDTINYIVENIEPNIRDIGGALKSIKLHQEINKKSVNMSNVNKFIRHNLKPRNNLANHSDVITKICGFYEIGSDGITTKSRKRELVQARQIIMYILRNEYNASYSLIGKKLGNRDHTTVIYACEKIEKDLKINIKLQRDLEQIKRMLDL